MDNSAAFGFSITITASYGALNDLAGTPSLADIAGFALGAAAVFTVFQALVTRGFRTRLGAAPREVVVLATALDIVSVALGLGAAMLAGWLLPAGAAWPLGALAAAVVFALSQTLQITAACRLQQRWGDPDAETDDR